MVEEYELQILEEAQGGDSVEGSLPKEEEIDDSFAIFVARGKTYKVKVLQYIIESLNVTSLYLYYI
jgi:hypothetical protein